MNKKRLIYIPKVIAGNINSPTNVTNVAGTSAKFTLYAFKERKTFRLNDFHVPPINLYCTLETVCMITRKGKTVNMLKITPVYSFVFVIMLVWLFSSKLYSLTEYIGWYFFLHNQYSFFLLALGWSPPSQEKNGE